MLTVTRLSPASFSGFAMSESKWPFVVIAISRDSDPCGRSFRQLAHKLDNTLPQKRLSARNANFRDPEGHQHARHPQIIRKWQLAVNRAFISSAAINTLVITAISNRDPQIGYGAAEFVGKRHPALSAQHSASAASQPPQ